MFVKIFQVSADEGMGKRSKLVEFSTQKRFQIRACLISGKSQESVSLSSYFWSFAASTSRISS